MRHDRLSKKLIETFFADFLHLTAPDSARRLRLGEPSFLDKELCTDWPGGARREVDLLARVPVKGSETALLIHVEIEARARAGMNKRLWKYYMQIRQRHDLLVLPILVNLQGGRPGVGLEILEEGFEPLATGTFRYRVLGLAGCHAEEWLPRPEPVAWALAALMQPGSWSRAKLKVECLRRVREWEDTGHRKEVLVDWIESYVQLAGEDAAEYQSLLSLKENKEVREMELTWLERAEAKGRTEGVARGRAQERARSVDQLRRMVLAGIEQRFGAVPERVQAGVQAVRAVEPLGEMLKNLWLVQSADDLLPRRSRRPKS
jgi:hypothetical protein